MPRRSSTTEGSHTPFGDLVSLCGLSQAEAGAYLSVDENTVWRRSTGRSAAPDVHVKALTDLWTILLTTDIEVDIFNRPLPAGALARRRALRLVSTLGAAVPTPVPSKLLPAAVSAVQAAAPSEPRMTRAEKSAANKANFRQNKNASAIPLIPADSPWTYDGLGNVKPGDILRINDQPYETMVREGPDGELEPVPGFSDKPQEVFLNGRKVRCQRQTIVDVTHVEGDSVYVRVLHSHATPGHMRRLRGYRFIPKISGFNSKAGEHGPITSRLINPGDHHDLVADLERNDPTPIDPNADPADLGTFSAPASVQPSAPVPVHHFDPEPIDEAADTDDDRGFSFDDDDDDSSDGSDDCDPGYIEAPEERDDEEDSYHADDAVSEDGISGRSNYFWQKKNVEDLPSF